MRCNAPKPGTADIFCDQQMGHQDRFHLSGPVGAFRESWSNLEYIDPTPVPSNIEEAQDTMLGVARRTRRRVRAPAPPRPGLTTPHAFLHSNPHDTEIQASDVARETSGTKRLRVYQIFVIANELGVTDPELQELLGMDGNTERPRRIELVERGYVEDSGRRRLHPTTGNLCIVWIWTGKTPDAGTDP
jgi:hypothetical protein